MKPSNEVVSAIENGTFDSYIDVFKTTVFTKNVNLCCLKNISWLSAAVFDKDLRKGLKSNDVIRAVEIFCGRLNNLQEEKLINNYLNNMRVLLDYFKDAKDPKAIWRFAEFMTISRHPLIEITDCQIGAYSSYIKLLFTCDLKYSKDFAKNIVLSVIQLIKLQEPQFTNDTYVQNVCYLIHYCTDKLKAMCKKDSEIVCNFVCSAFAALKECKIKTSMLSKKSCQSLLSCLMMQAELCFNNKLFLPVLQITSKSLQSIGSESSNSDFWSLIFEFYRGIENSLNKFLKTLEQQTAKDELEVMILAHIIEATKACNSVIDYRKAENIFHIQNIMNVYQIIIKMFQEIPTSTCKYCSNELHNASYVHSYMVNLHYKLVENQNPNYCLVKDLLVNSYKSFHETVKTIWANNCLEKMYHCKLMFNNYIRFTSLVSKNECINTADKIMFLEQYLKSYTNMYKMAKETCLLPELNKNVSQNYLSTAVNLMTDLYFSSDNPKKAMFSSCIAAHFFNMSFKKYFNAKFYYSECKLLTSYDILTCSTLTAGYGLSIDNKDFVKLLLVEIEASYQIWRSFTSMQSTAQQIFKLSTDPMILAKACVLLPLPRVKADVCEIVNKAFDRLVASMNSYRETDLVMASTLLASLHYMKYMVEIEVYKNEISQGNSILSSAPEVPDRDGLINANDTCNINPTAAKLNIKAEQSIMEHLVEALELSKYVFKNIVRLNSQNCYLEINLYYLEEIALSCAERGYESLKTDCMMLAYRFSIYLKKEMIRIRCVARLVTSMFQNAEMEPIIKSTTDIVTVLLSDDKNKDAGRKLTLCDFLLSYAEYLWNNSEYQKGYIVFRYAQYLIGDGSISKLLLARVHWVRSLFRRTDYPLGEKVIKHEATESICFDLVSAFAALEECWKLNNQDMYHYLYSLGFFHNLIRDMGRYFLHIYQNRLANYYLKMALKLAEKHAYAYQIGEILCILSRIDLRNQKTDQCELKVMALVDILYPSESVSRKLSQVIREEKIVDTNQIINQRTEILADNFRDGSVLVPDTNTNKFLRLASIGSPALCQLVHKLPIFFSHEKNCKCINCQNLTIHRLYLEAINVQANLSSFMGNMKIADEYYKNCKRIVEILNNKKSFNINLEVYFQMSYAVFMHDYSIHLYRAEMYSEAMDTIDTSIRIFTDVSKFDRVLYQDILSLKDNYLFEIYREMYAKETSASKETVEHDDLEQDLTPSKMLNDFAFKTPACSKVVPKAKSKFVIHEDLSPIAASKLKFVLPDSDDEDESTNGRSKSTKSSKSRSSTKSSDSDKSIYQTPCVKSVKQNRKAKTSVSAKGKSEMEGKNTNEDDEVFASPEILEKHKNRAMKLEDEDDGDTFYTPLKDNSVISCGGLPVSLMQGVKKLVINDDINIGKIDLRKRATRNNIAKNVSAVPNNWKALPENKKDDVKKSKDVLKFDEIFMNISPIKETQSVVLKNDNDVFYTPKGDKINKAVISTIRRPKRVQSLKDADENCIKTSKVEAIAKIEPCAVEIEADGAQGTNIDVSITSNDTVIESSIKTPSPPKTVRKASTRKTKTVLNQVENNDKPGKKPNQDVLGTKPKRPGRKPKNPFIL